MQRKWYRSVLVKDIDVVNGLTGKKEGETRLMNLVMQHCWVDGRTAHEDRISAIDDYNKLDSEKFIFLHTRRARGLGINLTSANVVALYDSDWNPHADLQAMDPAHQISQTKQVYTYRFIKSAVQKLRLDQLVLQQGRAQQAAKSQANKDALLEMVTTWGG